MWSTQRCILGLALHLTAVTSTVYNTNGAINHDAQPYVMSMVNNASIGPDGTLPSIVETTPADWDGLTGPWWYISQPVAYPYVISPPWPERSFD